ncbi:MAG TPA: MBG domain-containing protein [Verrucomicrobiae bacterium]|nr:MBG domain-containing protein [Verrucomicrobiae bacterium]
MASDDFIRDDGPLGTNWAYPIASETTFVITNDAVTPAESDHHTEACWTSDSFSNDQYSQIRLTTIGPWTGVVLRADTNQDEFYLGFVFGPNDYRIYARYGYTNIYQYFSLATGSTATWQTNDIMKMEVSGSNDPVTVTMYQNNAPVLVWRSTADTDALPVKNGGSPGIGIYSRTGDNLTLDDWQGGNLNPDTTPPSAPANLNVTVASPSELDLNWSSSTDDVGVVGYVVERSDGPGSTNFIQIATPTATNFSDVGLAPDTTYNYIVSALDAAGNVSDPSQVTALTPDPPPPTISAISDQTTLEGIAVGPFPFYISDGGVDPYSLSVTATSSNTELVPNQNIFIANSGSTQAIALAPAQGLTGASIITVTVSNGKNSTNASFLLTVTPPDNGTDVFANASNIVIFPLSPAAPYPSTINISGEAGTITNVMVTLQGMSHNDPGNVNALLVGPGGQAVVLMSDSIGNYPMSDITFTLSDQAYYPLPAFSPMVDGTFEPTDYAPDHTNTAYSFPLPAPAPPYATGLSTFDGSSPDGTWSLYVSDGETGDTGEIVSWSLAIATISPPTITGLMDLSTSVNTPTAAIPFEIEDAQTPPSNLVLAATSSDPALVNASTDILFGGSGSNCTITVTPESNTIGTATISVIVTDGDGLSATNSFSMMVNPGSLTVTGITASNRMYDGTTTAALNISGANLTGDGLSGSDVTLNTSTASGFFIDPNVGTNKTVQITGLTLDGSDAGNYMVIPPGDVLANITPATLTVSAANYSRSYGLPNPVLSANYDGFVNGEGTDVLTGVPGLSTSATINSPPGAYDITASAGTLSATNYSFAFVNGTLTVIDLPKLSVLALSGSQGIFSWPTITNQTYQLETTTNFSADDWSPVGDPIMGTGSPIILTNSLDAVPQQFFRLSIGPN